MGGGPGGRQPGGRRGGPRRGVRRATLVRPAVGRGEVGLLRVVPPPPTDAARRDLLHARPRRARRRPLRAPAPPEPAAARLHVRHRRGGRGLPRGPGRRTSRSTRRCSTGCWARPTPTWSSASARRCGSGSGRGSRADRFSRFLIAFHSLSLYCHPRQRVPHGSSGKRTGASALSARPGPECVGFGATGRVLAMARLQVIGGGRMGEALIAGLLGSGWAQPAELRVVEAADDRRRGPGRGAPRVRGGRTSTCGRRHRDRGQAGRRRARSSATWSPPHGGRILSIAAGVTLAALEAAAGPGVAVVRAMPNTPALVGTGAAAICPGHRGHRRGPRLGRRAALLGRHGRPRRRAAARRRHGAVGLRPGLRVPVRRGDDRRRRARRAAP